MPPFEIIVALYAGKMRRAYQSNLLNWQAAPKFLKRDYTHATLKGIP